MNIADTFIPTAGTVGLFPMVTYFLQVVAMLAFLGLFCFPIFLSGNPSRHRLMAAGLAVAAAITGIVYYLIQSAYHDLLAELVPVTDATDRLTLIRESYNAMGQYRYMAWIITTPLLLLQIVSMLNNGRSSLKSRTTGLVILAAGFMVLTGYLGHEQLSFDNEIQTGAKAGWGIVSAIGFGVIVFILNRLRQASGNGQPFPIAFRFFAGSWIIYFLGYFLSLTDINFNWIHIACTLTDLVSQLGLGLVSYPAWSDTASAASSTTTQRIR